MNRAAQALLSAKRPVFYVGGGVIQADAETSLREQRAVAGQSSTLMGLGADPGSDEQSPSMLGMHNL